MILTFCFILFILFFKIFSCIGQNDCVLSMYLCIMHVGLLQCFGFVENNIWESTIIWYNSCAIILAISGGGRFLTKIPKISLVSLFPITHPAASFFEGIAGRTNAIKGFNQHRNDTFSLDSILSHLENKLRGVLSRYIGFVTVTKILHIPLKTVSKEYRMVFSAFNVQFIGTNARDR